MEALAADLSERFCASVEYGYYDDFGYDLEGNQCSPSFNHVVQGIVAKPNVQTTLWLGNCFHQIHQLIEKFGAGVYERPYFATHRYLQQKIDEAVNSLCFELQDKQNGDFYLKIYNDTVYNFYHSYEGRWWDFCSSFTEENKDTTLLEHVNPFRAKVMELVRLLGGHEVVYIDDQGDSQYLMDSYFGWKSIKEELKTNFKEATLYVSEFVKQNKLLPANEYPLAFYDDFADLKETKESS